MYCIACFKRVARALFNARSQLLCSLFMYIVLNTLLWCTSNLLKIIVPVYETSCIILLQRLDLTINTSILEATTTTPMESSSGSAPQILQTQEIHSGCQTTQEVKDVDVWLSRPGKWTTSDNGPMSSVGCHCHSSVRWSLHRLLYKLHCIFYNLGLFTNYCSTLVLVGLVFILL